MTIKINKTIQKHIDEDIINLFINKLFEECNYSPYMMTKRLMDFICNSIYKNKCTNCDIDEIKDELYNCENKLFNCENDLDYEKNERKALEKDIENLKKRYRRLKKNSVIFSMEDVEDEP